MSATHSYDPEAFNRLPFRDKLEVLYGVSATDKRDLILASPEAQRLVRSFAPESLFYTLKEIGPNDGCELVALASGEQMCSLVDLDCWKKDRLDTASMLDWLEVILEGGTRPLGELLHAIDLPLLVVFLKRFIRVHRTDDPEEESPDLEGPEILELDEHYRIEFLQRDARAGLVRQLLEGLYERDYSYFVTVMEEVWWGMESELEERSFALRNARLQDRGFPDYFEALEIYKPLAESELAERLEPLGRTHGPDQESDALPLERSLLLPEEGRSFLSEVMSTGFDFDGQNELRHEMAYLTNRVMIAEGVDYADREAVAAAVRLAHDTTNLALEALSGKDRRRAHETLAHRYLQHLFRLGWGLLLGLRRRSRGVLDSLGIPITGGTADFLDTPYREGLEGFLRPKPRFFRGIDTPGEIRYRPFESLADLEHARSLVDEIASLPVACRRLVAMDLEQVAELRPGHADDFRLSAVFLTAFVHLALGHSTSLQPLSTDELAAFHAAALDEAGRGVRADLRERFLRESEPAAARFLDFCLARLEDEFLCIAPGEKIDPRFVTCLMVAS